MQGKGVGFTFDSPLNEAEGTEIVRDYYEYLNILAAGAKVDPTVVVVVISTVLGTAIGYANGKKQADVNR